MLFYAKIAGVLISFIFLIWFTYFLSHHKSHQVTDITVSGQKYISEDDIRNIALEKINGNYLFLFSKKSSFLIPRSDIKREIKDNFKSVEKVSISFESVHSFSITIKEFEPVAKWCDEEGCYLMNDNGTVFIKEPMIFTESLVNFYGLFEGEKIGQTFISKEKFEDILEFVKNVKELDLNVKNVTYDKEDGTLDLMLARGSEIYVNQNDDLNVALKNLKAAIQQDAIEGAQLNNIEYIDLRFGKKVFYKLR